MALWGKAVERRPREASLEILLELFQIEFCSVEMFKYNLMTFKLGMMEGIGD